MWPPEQPERPAQLVTHPWPALPPGACCEPRPTAPPPANTAEPHVLQFCTRSTPPSAGLLARRPGRRQEDAPLPSVQARRKRAAANPWRPRGCRWLHGNARHHPGRGSRRRSRVRTGSILAWMFGHFLHAANPCFLFWAPGSTVALGGASRIDVAASGTAARHIGAGVRGARPGLAPRLAHGAALAVRCRWPRIFNHPSACHEHALTQPRRSAALGRRGARVFAVTRKKKKGLRCQPPKAGLAAEGRLRSPGASKAWAPPGPPHPRPAPSAAAPPPRSPPPPSSASSSLRTKTNDPPGAWARPTSTSASR
jgi:hypothetical protein